MAIRLAGFATLVAVATLNREMTGVLIWLSLFAAYPRRWRWWLPCGLLVVAVMVGLRWWIPAHNPSTIAAVWQANLEPWRVRNLVVYGGLLLPALALLYLRAGQAPRRVRRMVLVVLAPYVALVVLLGVWQEVRLWMPVFLLAVPLLAGEGDSHA